MTTRAYILCLFLTAITGVVSFDLITGNSYDVLTNKGKEANKNRIVIEEVEHIQKQLPLILIVADLIIGSSETYLQDNALLEIRTLKGQLDHVGHYALVQSTLSQLAVIDKQLDTISSQLVDAGKIIKTGNKNNLAILLSKFDYTSLALIRTLNAFHESLRIQADHFDAQFVADREKNKIIIYTMMLLLLIVFCFFTHLALKNIDTPIRLMTTAADNALLFGQPYTAKINGSIEVNRLSRAMNSFIGKLESAVAKKTLVISKLETTNKELIETQLQLIQAEKLETTGTLAAGVAHEVKNPLAIIQFGIEYIAKDKHINSNLAHVIDDIEDAIGRADAVIKSLLNFTSISQLKFDVTDINPVVTESISLLKHEILKKHINLTLELGDNLPQVKIDKNKIQQVLVNLIMNAIHAMDNNGVLSIKTYATTCKEISAIKNLSNTDQYLIGNNAVVIETEDNGTGISNEIIDKIFEPFVTMQLNGKGTGLGLTVVYNIVRLHKAIIKIKNRKHHGVNAALIFRDPINKQMNNRVQS
jgi:signal transduction histidine kinase